MNKGSKGLKFGTIEQSVLLDATPERVFEAYVDLDRHAEFTGTAVSGASRVGGEFKAGDGYISGKFLVLERGKRIVQEWKTTEWPSGYPSSLLELSLEPTSGKTELKMVHSRVPAEQVDYYAQGWKDFYWKPLSLYLSKVRAKRPAKRKPAKS